MNPSERKKILILVDWFYPGYKAGGPIQSCRNFIAAMQNNFDINLITSDRDLGDVHAYPDIKVNEWNNYSSGTKVFYASALTLKQLQRLCNEINPDYLYINSMFSLRFTIYPLWLSYRNKIGPQLVLAPRGMLHRGALQFKAKRKQWVLWLISKSGIQKKIIFHATDQQEEKDIRLYFPHAKAIKSATNFPRILQQAFVPSEKNAGELKCIFISRLSPKKNIQYLLRLLQQVPPGISVNLEIWGQPEDETYLRHCLLLIDALPSSVTAHINGSVENDAIPDLLKQQHLFVLPTLGENFGHAIFEALSAGRPVLISDKTPWKNLAEKKAGWDLPLEHEKEFSAVLEKVAAMETFEWNEWCKGAWELADNFISQTDIRAQYLAMFN